MRESGEHPLSLFFDVLKKIFELDALPDNTFKGNGT